MTHFTRTHLDAVWNNGGLGGYQTVETDWESLDAKFAASINGVRGGTWAPSTPITFGDVGNPVSPSLVVNGSALVAFGGSLTTRAGSRFIFNAASIPRLGAKHVGRKRKIPTPCVRRQSSPLYTWLTNTKFSAAQSIALTIAVSEGGETITSSNPFWPTTYATQATKSLLQPSFHVELDVHDGATLARTTFTFRVPTPRSGSPLSMPQFRVVAIDDEGNIFPLKKTDDGSGYASAVTPTGVAWYAGGESQSFVYECDQNNVVDISRFYYVAQVIEEVGATNFPSKGAADGILVVDKHPTVQCASTTNITTLATLLTIDGHTLSAGERVLVKNQSNTKENGIYVASTGTWARASDADETADFTPYSIVAVGGDGRAQAPQTSQLGQVWQLATAQPIVVGTDPIVWQRAKPNGNIYHAVTCEFEQIADLRFP